MAKKLICYGKIDNTEIINKLKASLAHKYTGRIVAQYFMLQGKEYAMMAMEALFPVVSQRNKDLYETCNTFLRLVNNPEVGIANQPPDAIRRYMSVIDQLFKNIAQTSDSNLAQYSAYILRNAYIPKTEWLKDTIEGKMRVGPRETVPDSNRFDDPRTRSNEANKHTVRLFFNACQNEQVADVLIENLQSKDCKTRAIAAYCLGLMKAHKAEPQLIKALDDENTEVQADAAYALTSMAYKSRDKTTWTLLTIRAASIIYRRPNYSNFRAHPVWAENCYKAKDWRKDDTYIDCSKIAVEPLIKGLQSTCPRQRQRSAQIMGRLRDRGLAKHLLAALKDEAIDVRIEAMDALVRLQAADKDVIECMAKEVDSLLAKGCHPGPNDHTTRDKFEEHLNRLAKMLGNFNDPRGIKALVSILTYDDIPQVLLSCLKIGQPTQQALMDIFPKVNHNAQSTIGRILEKVGDKDTLDFAMKYVKQKTNATNYLISLIARHYDKRAEALVVSLIEYSYNGTLIRLAAEQNISQAGPTICRFLDRPIYSEQDEAMRALGKMKYKPAVPKLIEMARKSNMLAMQTLAEIGDPAAMPVLQELSAKAESKEARIAAFNAYIAMSGDKAFNICEKLLQDTRIENVLLESAAVYVGKSRTPRTREVLEKLHNATPPEDKQHYVGYQLKTIAMKSLAYLGDPKDLDTILASYFATQGMAEIVAEAYGEAAIPKMLEAVTDSKAHNTKRRFAREALTLIGEPAIQPLLGAIRCTDLNLDKTPDAGQVVTDMILADNKDPRLLEALVAMMQKDASQLNDIRFMRTDHTSPDRKRLGGSVIIALREYVDMEAFLPELIKALEKEKQLNCRNRMLAVVQTFATHRHAASMLKCMEVSKGFERQDICRALCDILTAETVPGLLDVIINEEDYNMRYCLIKILEQRRVLPTDVGDDNQLNMDCRNDVEQAIFAEVAKYLKSKNPKIRRNAVLIVREIEHPQTIEILLEAVRDSDSGVRAAAAAKLGMAAGEQYSRHFGDGDRARIVKVLAVLLSDDSEYVRNNATSIITYYNTDALECLIPLLRSDDAELRLHIAQIWAKTKRPESEPFACFANKMEYLAPMINLMADKDARVRLAAAKVLHDMPRVIDDLYWTYDYMKTYYKGINAIIKALDDPNIAVRIQARKDMAFMLCKDIPTYNFQAWHNIMRSYFQLMTTTDGH